MARPTKYNDERAARIVEALRAGNTRRAAIAYGGISQDSFARWLERFADFADSIARAEAEVEVRNVAIIQKAAGEHDVSVAKRVTFPDGTIKEEIISKREFDWQAAAWWLERRRADDWKKREETTLRGAEDAPLVIKKLGVVSMDEI